MSLVKVTSFPHHVFVLLVKIGGFDTWVGLLPDVAVYRVDGCSWSYGHVRFGSQQLTVK